MIRTSVWLVVGNVVSERLHNNESACVVASGMDDAIRGYEEWAYDMWPTGFRRVDVTKAERIREFAVIPSSEA